MSSTDLKDEINANFSTFDTQWKNELNSMITVHSSKRSNFENSYLQIATIQAWRTSIIAELMNDDCSAFFFEAQNDLLVSHCLAHCGSFRQSLKALRSCIENVYFSLYYMDHPIELTKWTMGKHKLGFTGLHTYLETHPKIETVDLNKCGLAMLKDEYATLSKAVHSSAKQFRMTSDLIDTKLWTSSSASLGQWATREKTVIRNINQLLVYMFANSLKGTQNLNLRKTLSLVLTTSQKNQLSSDLGINLR